MKISIFSALVFAAAVVSAQEASTSLDTSQTVRNVHGKPVPLKAVLANPTVLVYYPGGCGSCDGVLQELKEATKGLGKLGHQAVAVSSDSPEDLAKTAKRLSFPASALFSDAEMAVADALKVSFNAGGGAPYVFLIGSDGNVQSVSHDLAATIRSVKAPPTP